MRFTASRLHGFTIVALLATTLFAGCRERLTPEQLKRQQEQEAYISLDQELDFPPQPTIDTFTIVTKVLEDSSLVDLDPKTSPAVPRAGLYRRRIYRVKEHSLQIAGEAKGLFSPALIYPGNILSLKGAQESQWIDAPDLIPFRKQLPFYVNVLNGRAHTPVTPDDMRPESVASAINSLLTQDLGAQPGSLLHVVAPVYSEADLLRTIGFEENDPLVKPLLDKIDFDKQFRKTIVVYLEQRLLSLACTMPDGGAKGIFKPTTDPTELAELLRNYRNEGLTYVSEVNYGRTFILVFQETKLSYMTAGDAVKAIRNLLDSSLTPAQRETQANILLNRMSVSALQLGGHGLISIGDGGAGILNLYETLTQSGTYKPNDPLQPTSFSLRTVGSSRPVYFPIETKRIYNEEVYIDQNAHNSLTITPHSLTGQPLTGPEGGNYKNISNNCEFRLDVIRIEKRVNGVVKDTYSVLSSENFSAIGGFSRSLPNRSCTYKDLDPYNTEGLEIRVIIEARLYGERWGTGRSDGEQVAVREEAIITFDPAAGRWNCSAPRTLPNSDTRHLYINRAADRCRFRANLYFSVECACSYCK